MITIIVLIILATISINAVFGENGLIAKVEQSKAFHELEKERERLELVKTQVATDVVNLGKVTVDNYVEELIKENITVVEEVTDNGDGSKTVITDTGYSVTILPKGDRDVEIIIDGKASELAPKIVRIDISTTQTSFTAKANIRHINGGTVEYLYRIHGKMPEDVYKSITNITKEGVTVTGLVSGESYDIKVIATNENGSDEKIEMVTTTKVLIDEIKLEETATVKEGKNINLTATILPQNATNQELEWVSSNENIVVVDNNGKITGKAVGKTNIMVKAKDGSDKEAKCEVTVTPKTIADLRGEEIFKETKTIKDEKENEIVVPKGFKIANDSGTTVQEGIVVEDSEENQFVWVPVSNINHDGSNRIRLNNNSEVEITLGRYTFDTTTGNETKVQYGAEYATTVTTSSYFQELVAFREANQTNYNTGTNATAKDLKRFVESVRDNHGYYMARYEASYGSGTTFGVGNDSSYYKPLSKVSTAYYSTQPNYTKGTLWNYITQGNASKVSRQMYYGNANVGVESDLCNSYAWDTAIVYIQAMGNKNYANMKCEVSTKNTGTTGDEKCHIFDMSANCTEWTTEYSTYKMSPYAYPCSVRGGNFLGVAYCTSNRFREQAGKDTLTYSFRPILYVQ